MAFLLVVIYVVFISLGFPDSIFGVSWPVIHTEMGLSESFASVYNIIVGICTGGVSFFAGKLIRKFGTGKVTVVSILLTVLGLFGMSFAPNIFVMVIFAVILGNGAGVIDTGLNNFVSLHYKAKHMNFLHCFWGIGVTLSPMIMSVFLKGNRFGAWREGYRAVGIIQALIMVFAAFSLKKWKEVEKTQVNVADGGEKPKEKSLFELLKIKGVVTGILSLGFYCGMEFLVGTWGASYIVNVYAISPDIAAKWVSLYYGGIMLGRLISGFVSVKMSDSALIKAGIGVAFAGIFILLMPFGKASLSGLLLMGIGFGPIFPNILHIIPDRFGETYSADITGYHMGGAYAMGFTVQLIFGFVAPATTFKLMPFVLLMLCVMLVVMNTVTEKTVARIKNKQ